MVVVTRQPLVGVSLAAIAGILLSPIFSTWEWIVGGLGILILWQFFGGTHWILLATVCVFGCLHRLQTVESAAALFSRFTESSTIWQGQGVITKVFRPFRGATSLVVETERLCSSKSSSNYSFPLRVLVPWHGKPPVMGSRIKWRGSMRSSTKFVTRARYKGSFDRRAATAIWLSSIGIYLEFYKVATAEVISLPRIWYLPLWAIRARQRAEQGMTQGIESKKKEAALIRALTLGADQETEKMLSNIFRRTGAYHIFSVSGLHIGMVAAIAWQVFKILRIPRSVAVFMSIVLLFSYAGITGFRPPALRAACMVGVFLCGAFAKRRALVLNSLAAAALGMLCWDSKQLFRPGFQLSFVVVASIACFAPVLYRLLFQIFMPDAFLPRRLLTPLQRLFERLGCAISAAIAVSISAWIGSTPLLLWHFQSISFSALFVNLLIVPLAFLILNLAVLSLLCDFFISPWLATIFAHANLLPASMLLAIVEWAGSMPWGFFQWSKSRL